jgi:hypothetical protein
VIMVGALGGWSTRRKAGKETGFGHRQSLPVLCVSKAVDRDRYLQQTLIGPVPVPAVNPDILHGLCPPLL